MPKKMFSLTSGSARDADGCGISRMSWFPVWTASLSVRDAMKLEVVRLVSASTVNLNIYAHSPSTR
jgi:hypothetical protein